MSEYDRVRLILDLNVYEPEKLMAYAKKRVEEAWGEVSGDDPDEMTLEKAVYEAIFGSSEGPPCTEIGLEIQHYEVRKLGEGMCDAP
jgi:hypothetical protein